MTTGSMFMEDLELGKTKIQRGLESVKMIEELGVFLSDLM